MSPSFLPLPRSVAGAKPLCPGMPPSCMYAKHRSLYSPRRFCSAHNVYRSLPRTSPEAHLQTSHCCVAAFMDSSLGRDFAVRTESERNKDVVYEGRNGEPFATVVVGLVTSVRREVRDCPVVFLSETYCSCVDRTETGCFWSSEPPIIPTTP
jgi:hypothetical protein